MRVLFLSLFILAFATLGFAQNFDEIAPSDSPKSSIGATSGKESATPETEGGCKDDPRLETDLAEIMESNAPVKPLLTVTPETFLNMDEEAIAALGGKMLVCPNNPVLKNGKTMKKVQIDFAPLWANIRKAAADGNVEQLKRLLNDFRALPMPSAEIVKLFIPINLDEKTAKTLFSAAGIKPLENYSNKITEFYIHLGGKPADNSLVCVDDVNKIGQEEISQIKKKYPDAIFLMNHNSNFNERLINELRAAKVNANECGKMF